MFVRYNEYCLRFLVYTNCNVLFLHVIKEKIYLTSEMDTNRRDASERDNKRDTSSHLRTEQQFLYISIDIAADFDTSVLLCFITNFMV